MFDLVVNYWAVLVATIAAFAFGAIWHGPLFGKVWMKLNGLTAKDMKKPKMANGLTPTSSMIGGFIATLLVSFVLAKFIAFFGAATTVAAVTLAFWLWLGFSMPIVLGSYLWEGKSCKLFAFNAVYRLLELSVMAAVLASWV